VATWNSSYVTSLPDSAFACVDSEGRHYPHHDASGTLDLPHLRAALSRIGDASNTQCGKGHLQSHASSAGVGKALVPVKATVIDDDHFRLLAIPFGGPIPKAGAPRGVDLDGEWFSEQTDIKADWFPFRLVDWHHRRDALMGDTIIGKATLDDEPEEDGWWVDVWLKHGEKRLSLVRRLAERGAKLFGSSEAMPSLVQKAQTGEILVWPYMRQTLSTSPQNTYSVLRPLKATLDDLAAEDAVPTAAFFDDLTRFMDNLGSDPAPEGAAKTGRVLASRNEARLREALQDIDEAYFDPKRRRRAIAAMTEVLDELERYLA
jgi:hypothetical protein